MKQKLGLEITITNKLQIKQKLKNLILNELYLKEKIDDIANSKDLLKAGIIDSLNLVILILLIERNFGITILDKEVLPENFGTLEKMIKFIQKKIKSQQ